MISLEVPVGVPISELCNHSAALSAKLNYQAKFVTGGKDLSLWVILGDDLL